MRMLRVACCVLMALTAAAHGAVRLNEFTTNSAAAAISALGISTNATNPNALTNLDTRAWTNNTGIYGNGYGLTNLAATNLVGTIPTNNLTANAPLNGSLMNFRSGVSSNTWMATTNLLWNGLNLMAGGGFVLTNGQNTATSMSNTWTWNNGGVAAGVSAADIRAKNTIYTDGQLYAGADGSLGIYGKWRFMEGTKTTPNMGAGAAALCSWGSSVDALLGTRSLTVLSNANVGGSLYVTSTIACSNLTLSTPRWVDAPGQIFGALPAASPKTLTPTVSMSDGTFSYVFSQTDGTPGYGDEIVPFTSEAPHSIWTTTNSTWMVTNLYVEPHFHGRPLTAPAAPNTNISFTVMFKACSPGSAPSVTWTNTVTYGLTAGSTNEMLIEFGHLTYQTNFPNLATTWSATITTADPGSNQYLAQANAGFIIRAPSFHVPVGGLGSTTDAAP